MSLFSFVLFVVDPVVNGLRRRAQSLNFVIHSNQPIVDYTKQTLSTVPIVKRRRKQSIGNVCLVEDDLLISTMNMP
jgi:catabolite regulation protein CreA